MENILITAIGRRVQLIKHLKNKFKVIGVDATSNAPATNFVDKFYQLPKYYDANYINSIIYICKKNSVKLIIPLYEKEFGLLADNRNLFENLGIKLLLSDKKIIDICSNKFDTYKFFKAQNILTPKTYLTEEIYKTFDFKFPMIIKPIDGMGSEQTYKIKSKKELDFFIEYVDTPIVQDFKCGIEYTVDVLCDFEGDIISIVPRERLEVRAGEVSKSRTVKNTDIICKTKELVEKLNLNGKVIGPITIQCIREKDNIYFIEINPRFGGGVPLTFEAGIDYSYYLSEILKNNKIENMISEFKELTMLRYDEAIFK